MGAGATDRGADHAKMRLHCWHVAIGHHRAGALALFRANRVEGEPLSAIGPKTMASGPLGASVVGRPRPRAAPRVRRSSTHSFRNAMRIGARSVLAL